MITMSETRDPVSICIDNILLDLSSSPSKHSIFRVNHDMRCINEKLYDPKILSVGPYHHGKDHLLKMEQHKFWYLKLLLNRRKESTVDTFVVAVRSLEEKARRCYADPVEFSPDDFVKMLLLDGCFIIELIRKYGLDPSGERDDTIFKNEQVLSQLRHDLMLVENQIPFFVLYQLFSMTETGNPNDHILYLIRLFLDDIFPWPEASKAIELGSLENADHLLSLMYKIWCPPLAPVKMEEKKIVAINMYKIWCCLLAMMTASRPVKKEKEKIVAINSVTELKEAGIKFEKDTESNCLDIKFIKGVMRIPGFGVSDETESVLRNLIAYEGFFVDNHPKYVTDYAFFLQRLINSSKDVEILRRRRILSNLLGDDDMVYRMFNRLGRNILLSSDFFYADVFDKVNGHCRHRRNRWMANLRHNYFNSPWAYISFFAALMLLFFTLIQTVFSVLSYKRGK